MARVKRHPDKSPSKGAKTLPSKADKKAAKKQPAKKKPVKEHDGPKRCAPLFNSCANAPQAVETVDSRWC
jgi:hypothetical protein